MSAVNSLRRIVPIWNVAEMRKARQELFQRLSTTELAGLVAAWFGTARWSRREDCYKLITRALDETAGDSLRKNVRRLQGSRCEQLTEALISMAEYEKKFRDGLLNISTTIEIPEIYLPQDIPNEKVPYPGFIDEEQGSCTLVNPWDITQNLTFYSQETKKIRLWSQQTLDKLTYQALSVLLKCLLSYIEPRFREVYSHKRGIVPSWWPRAIKFKGKNNYDKAVTVALILYIIFDLHSEGFRVVHAIDAIKLHPRLIPQAKEILYSIMFVRQLEESYRGDLCSTVVRAEMAVMGRGVAQGVPTDPTSKPSAIRQATGIPHPSISTEGTAERPYYIVLGVNSQGNFFRSVSRSLNIDNLSLSAAEESFRQEVSRVKEQRRAYLSQVLY
ncbi:hypothetical protein BDV23DRAFT_182403 [Aspergillus alliaceus]|uniref:Uncharacterized protein n=1 Tax=Petromyces alliaceus TaxID=209559 RepID=A0A5N7CBQ9_PETAA|nr:hypothetical protein BDV23DRAFT_182403 [Aspergillus alliaceus]